MSQITSDYKREVIRSLSNLTAGYVASSAISEAQHFDQLVILYRYVPAGTPGTLSLKVEFSSDNINWHQEMFESIAGGTGTITLGIRQPGSNAAHNGRFFVDIADRYIRVSALDSGTGAPATLFMEAILLKR